MASTKAAEKIAQALQQIAELLPDPVIQGRDFLRVNLEKARTALSAPDVDAEDVLAVLSDLFEVQGSPTVQARSNLSSDILALLASLEDAEAAFSEGPPPPQPLPQP